MLPKNDSCSKMQAKCYCSERRIPRYTKRKMPSPPLLLDLFASVASNGPAYARLLLVLASDRRPVTTLDLVLEVLVHGEGDSLARRNTHYPRRNTLIECMESFLPVHQCVLVYRTRPNRAVSSGPTCLNISPAIAVILFRALTPSSAGVFCRRVLMVSIGALLRGPMAPLTSPMRVV